MKNLALHWRILIGMAAGVAFAAALIQFEWGKDFIVDWIKPFGTIFINLLKLIAIPLILGSLIKGIADLNNITQLSKMGVRTIAIYICTTVVAVSLGLVIVNVIKPGTAVTEQTRAQLISSYETQAGDRITAAEKQKQSGPLKALEDLVPENIVAAASSNGNMLQVIVFAIFCLLYTSPSPRDRG
jgi:Na+/H+-dicarboxylate symporter